MNPAHSATLLLESPRFSLIKGPERQDVRRYSPTTYGTGTTLQEARAYQINGVFRF
jgi:hypothetical protein